jgi:hypothetical protein
MLFKVGGLFITPARLILDFLLVVGTVFWFFIPVKRSERLAARQLEHRRAKANQSTLEALEENPNPTRPISPATLSTLHDLDLKQILIEKEIESLLKDRSIRVEQGLRAGAAAVMFQLSLLLRRVELRCASLAYLDTLDETSNKLFEDQLAIANGELDDATARYASIIDRYVKPLDSRAMRRERLARRLYWLVTVKWRDAFKWDVGIKDIRLELRGFSGLFQELRSGLKVFGDEFLSGSLHVAANDYADADDATLIQRISKIVNTALESTLDPRDQNYPVLIVRLWAIRAKLNELPAWSWSLRWRAYAAVLQSWLYYFAANGAAAKNDRTEVIDVLRRKALQMTEQIALLIAEIALLERPFKPIMTSFSMIGRQKALPGLPPPPSKEQLQEMADRLAVRLNTRQ